MIKFFQGMKSDDSDFEPEIVFILCPAKEDQEKERRYTDNIVVDDEAKSAYLKIVKRAACSRAANLKKTAHFIN